MAVKSQPRLRNYKAGGAIRPFRFVKWGSDNETMLECDANEKSMGIYQGEETLASGDFGEVALPGGGGLLEVSETVALGKFLTPTADGEGEVVDAANELYGAIAYESGVAGDVIGVEVIPSTESASTDA